MQKTNGMLFSLRLALIIAPCLLANCVDAQRSENSTPGKWQFSLSLSLSTDQDAFVSGIRLEVDPADFPAAQRPRPDTISVFGENRLFLRPSGASYPITPSDLKFRFGAQVKVHRQIGRGFQLAVGLHYDRDGSTTLNAELETGLLQTDGSRIEVLYPVRRIETDQFGLVTNFEYHLFQERRFHPYVGIGVSTLVEQSSVQDFGSVYTGQPGRILDRRVAAPADNTLFELDFFITSGILFRVTDHWLIGATAGSRIGTGSGTFGAQVRYEL